MSRDSDRRAELLASIPHTGLTMQQAVEEAARVEAEGIPPAEGEGE